MMKPTKHKFFTHVEKQVLLAAVKTYASIIENRSTDRDALHKKKLAWHNITKDYNASPHTTVETTCPQLKHLWNNLKHRQQLGLKRRQHITVTNGESLANNAKIDPDMPMPIENPGLSVDIHGTTDLDTTLESLQQHKNNKDTTIEKEYRDKFKRANEIHLMEKELLSYRIREAKAKAELAELIFQQRSRDSNFIYIRNPDENG